MHLEHLQWQGFRNLQNQKVEFQPGLNFFYGANGAGKTSVLEAIHVLASGKSFRGGQPRNWLQQGADSFLLAARWSQASDPFQAGVQWRQGEWQRRLNCQEISYHVAITRHFPCLALHPSTQQLVTAGPEGRRRLLNWLMFHVEPKFLSVWKDYQRVRAQRNALLRAQQTGWQLEEWTRQFIQIAEHLHQMQKQVFESWMCQWKNSVANHKVLNKLDIVLYPGWARQESLQAVLLRLHRRELEMGHTQAGPHRLDLRMRTEGQDAREWLSRGQQKLLAYTLLLSAASLVAEEKQAWPLIVLDDLQAELDANNLDWLLQPLLKSDCQLLANGLTCDLLASWWPNMKRFHVEHGRIYPE